MIIYRFLSLVSALLILTSNNIQIVDSITCTQIQDKIDQQESLDDVFDYLSYDISRQSELFQYFRCLGNSNGDVQRIPTVLNTNSSENYIFGDGRLWLRSFKINGNSYLNVLQNDNQSKDWAGKLFFTSSTNSRRTRR